MEEEKEKADWLKGVKERNERHDQSGLKGWEERNRKHEKVKERRGNKGGRGSVRVGRREGGTKSWAVCQDPFHLCSPGLPELPPSLTSVISSMKRPLGGMEDLTPGSDCDRHQLTLQAKQDSVRINWMSLSGTRNKAFFCCCFFLLKYL